MASITIDIQKLKAAPRRLKVVAAVIVFDLAFLLLGYAVLDDLLADRAAAVEQAKAQLTEAKRQNVDLRKQLDEYPLMRRHYNETLASGFVAPLDRLTFVQFAQNQATARHLSDLHFRVSDEGGEREHSKKYRVEMDRLVFESGGLLDTEAMDFWNTLFDQAKGHYRIAEASLERTQEVNAGILQSIRRGNPVSLLKAKIDIQWIGVQPVDQEAK